MFATGFQAQFIAFIIQRLAGHGKSHSATAQFASKGEFENSFRIPLFYTRAVITDKKATVIGIELDDPISGRFKLEAGAVACQPKNRVVHNVDESGKERGRKSRNRMCFKRFSYL